MIIYRGAGFITLLTPLVVVLLFAYLQRDPVTHRGDTTLSAFLLGIAIGAAINIAIGFALNRGPRPEGTYARHHFFFVPMQWPSLAIVVACIAVAVGRHF